MQKTELGRTYRDRITGFEGVNIGQTEYLTGCNQVLLQPKGSGDSAKRPEAEWFDIQRLEDVEAETITLDNGKTPGCDKQAPKR